MKRTVARIAGLAVVVGLFWAPSANASTRVFVQVGSRPPVYARGPVYAPVAVPVQYRPQYRYGYVWQPGYYIRVSYGQLRWVPGHWMRAPSARRGWGWGRNRWERDRWERDRLDRQRGGGAGFEFRYRGR